MDEVKTPISTAPIIPATTSNSVTGDGTPVGVTAPITQVNEPAIKPAGTDLPADWRADLPDELKADESIKTLKDKTALAKSYVELRKMQGSAIRKPGENATKEEVDSFYEKIGWEKDFDKVNAVVKGPILPVGLELKPEEVSNFAKTAHSLRLNAEQIQGVLNYYGDFVKGVIPDYKGDEAKAIKELGDTWGLALDRNMGVARKALFNEFPKETVERITRAGLANDVGFIKGMYERGKGLIEEGIIPEEIGQGIDEASAKTKIAEMEGDPKSPLYDKNHARHQEFVDKRSALYKVVYS